MTGVSFTIWSKAPSEEQVQLLPSQRNWWRVISSLQIVFQRDDAQGLKKDSSKLAKTFLKDLHLKGKEKGFTMKSFLK